ncbi:Hypothetical predicted protein [Octopus vulgaris]|uniref:Uncharacterized protein n=1 Tax=Octopus vulgaris TaxID=6645 RepID=A0AA36BFC6_OCTVU|nr:Hypothetical predicted protein [Octopus vulgaris]
MYAYVGSNGSSGGGGGGGGGEEFYDTIKAKMKTNFNSNPSTDVFNSLECGDKGSSLKSLCPPTHIPRWSNCSHNYCVLPNNSIYKQCTAVVPPWRDTAVTKAAIPICLANNSLTDTYSRLECLI